MLFRRLAVFSGGFTLEAAEFVAAHDDATSGVTPRASLSPPGLDANQATTEPPAILDLLTSLVAQNLIARQDQPDESVRFVMLETVREFALECLANSDEHAAIRLRHLEHYITLAERADRLVPRPDRWWEPFEVEWANMLSALAWSVEAGQPGLGLRLGGSMFGYWMLRGQVGEGINWLEKLLTAGANESPVVRGRGVVALGCLRWVAGDLDRSAALASEGQSLCEEAGDVIGAAVARFVQGFLAEARGDLHGAIASLLLARDMYLTVNQESAAFAATAHAGRIAGRLGDFERAKAQLTEAIPMLDRDEGGLWGAANAYASLGLIVAIEGDVQRGASLVDRALRLHAAIGDRLATLITVTNAAQILAMSGRTEAATLLGATDMMREQAGPSIWTVAQSTYERATELTRAWLAVPDFDVAFTAGQRLDTEQALTTARAGLASITPELKTSLPLMDVAPSLSPRERVVMQMVAAGHTDQEVATALGLRTRTVNAYVTNARRKLGATSRAAAAAEAVRRGLT